MENDLIKDLLKSITLDDRDQVEILVKDVVRQKVSDKFTNAIQNIQSNND